MDVELLRNSEIGMQTRDHLILLGAGPVVRALQTLRVVHKYFYWGLSRKVSGRLCWRVPPQKNSN